MLHTLLYLGWTVLEQCCKYNLTTDFWFSFGSPNKELSQRNPASPGHGAGGSNNTTAKIVLPSFIACTFWWCFANLLTPWTWCGCVFKWAVLGGRGRVLTFIKNISLGLRLQSLQLQGSYLCMNSLQHSKEKWKLEIASYDPFNTWYYI